MIGNSSLQHAFRESMAGGNRCRTVSESILEWYGDIPGTNRYLAELEDIFVFNQGGIAGGTSRPFSMGMGCFFVREKRRKHYAGYEISTFKL